MMHQMVASTRYSAPKMEAMLHRVHARPVFMSRSIAEAVLVPEDLDAAEAKVGRGKEPLQAIQQKPRGIDTVDCFTCVLC